MIIFKNGQSFNQTAIYGSTSHQGMVRKTVRICLPDSETTLQEAYAIYLNKDILSEITISNTQNTGEVSETGEPISVTYTEILLNYTMPVEFKVADINGVSNFQLTLAQKSDLEIEQEKLIQDNSDIQLALIELAEIVTGGE